MSAPVPSAPPVPPADSPPVSATPTNRSVLRLFGAEVVGTCVLIMIGPGTAIIASDKIGNLRRRLRLRPRVPRHGVHDRPCVGCHINPAVTLASCSAASCPGDGGVLLGGADHRRPHRRLDHLHHQRRREARHDRRVRRQRLGRQDQQRRSALPDRRWSSSSSRRCSCSSCCRARPGLPAGFGGLAVGLTLTMIHLATIPVDNTSVNPARSFGVAVFAGSDAMSQVWAFFVFPFSGAVDRRAGVAARARHEARGHHVREPPAHGRARPRLGSRPQRSRPPELITPKSAQLVRLRALLARSSVQAAQRGARHGAMNEGARTGRD